MCWQLKDSYSRVWTLRDVLRRHLAWGRVVIVVLAIVGLLPLLVESKALDATTVPGLVVMGLAPPIVSV